MSSEKNEKYVVPTILYEEPRPGQTQSVIPYIEVQKDAEMPKMIFIFEYKHTGETEPGTEGETLEIVDQIPHKYVDMEYLKEKLTPEVNDVVRVALGLKPLKEAIEKGNVILDNVAKKINERLSKE